MTQLTKIGKRTWTATGDFSVLSVNFGNRMTIIQLDDGSLAVHSVLRFDASLAEQIDVVGPVKHLIVPNRHHNLFTTEWQQRYPDAQLYAPPGTSRVQADHSLSASTLATLNQQWAPALCGYYIHGLPALRESVFYIPEDKVLVLTDIAFNIQHQNKWLPRLAFRAYGAYQQFGPTRLIRKLIRDREKFGDSIETLLTLDIETIVLSHGECINREAKTKLGQAFAPWLNIHSDARQTQASGTD